MERGRSAQLVSIVADSKTPLSKEVRSTSKMVNGRPGVGQAFHDLGSRSHEKITFFSKTMPPAPLSVTDMMEYKNVKFRNLRKRKASGNIYLRVGREFSKTIVEARRKRRSEIYLLYGELGPKGKKKSKFLKMCNTLDRLIKKIRWIDFWIGLR